MNGSSTSRPSGIRPDSGVSRGLAGVREVLDQLRSPTARRSDERPARDDVRAAVLTLLAEQPADGYRIVRVLEERGGGGRTPGAGSVYPTLQLLADEGLAVADDTDGRRIWTLTAAGHAAADAARDRSGPATATTRASGHRGAIIRSGAQLAQTVALAAQSVSGEQVGEVVAALDEARRRILSVLARG